MGDARSRARCCRLPGTNCCFPVPRCTNRFLLQSLYFPWTRQCILAAVFPQDVPTPTSHCHGAGLGTSMVPQSAARAAPFQTWCITERAAGLVALNGFHPLCSASCSVLFACSILFASCMQDLSSMQCCWLQAAPGCTQGPHCMQCPGCTHDAGCSQGPRCMQLAGCIRGAACMLCAACSSPVPLQAITAPGSALLCYEPCGFCSAFLQDSALTAVSVIPAACAAAALWMRVENAVIDARGSLRAADLPKKSLSAPHRACFPTNKLLPQLPHFLSLWPSTLQEILDPYQSKRGHEKSY